MQRQGWQHAVILVVSITVIAGCGTGGGFNLISLEEEWALGRQLEADIARQMQIVRDPAANAYINSMGQQMVSRTSLGNLPWNFHIVRSDEINAFNIPGGHVYVTTGLIRAARQASSPPGVMGHEIAHGVERHATQQMSRAYGLSMLAGVVLGQNPAIYQQILAQIIGTGAMASFSRDMEREADDLGVQMMAQSGYHPRGMVQMFQTLIAGRQASPGAVEKFFSTHPLTESRIDSIQRMIDQMNVAGLRLDEAEYQRIRGSL
jgi:beta-barrel assembly-enhancing protease